MASARPPNAPNHPGLVAVTLEVDTNGKVLGSKVSYEYPPGMGFGPEVAGRVRDAFFIPGFRAGKEIRCQFTWTLGFTGRSWQIHTG